MSSFSFWWEWGPYTLSPAAEDIGDVYNALGSVLAQNGYGNIVHAADMTANKNNFVVGIVFIYIGGSNFIQVVNCVTDLAAAEAATEGKKVQNMIKNLKFL